MKKIFLFIFLLLSGCAVKEPSHVLVKNMRQEVAAVQETVKKIEAQTPSACKTDVFLAHLEAINRQVMTMDGQIESISGACQTEKQVLKERITAREAVIFGLAVLVLVLVVCLIKRR